MQGFGKAVAGHDCSDLDIVGKVGAMTGFFRSDEAGATWVWINDDRYAYGTAGTVIGDSRVSGRVYVGTYGHGIL